MEQVQTHSGYRVAVIVLNWNGKQLTLDCLESLAKITATSAHVILVDNASTDDSVAAVTQAYGDRVTVIQNDENVGFSKGNNRGIRHALAAGAEYVLLLNNDTVVDPGFIEPMLAEFNDPRVGIVGSKIYYFNPPDKIWFAGGGLSFFRGRAWHVGIRHSDDGRFDTPGDTDYITGCSLMARATMLDQIGLLDPTYRAYYEDADLCVRARTAGWKIRYAPQSKVWHKISASTGGQVSRRKITQKWKSGLKFFATHARPWHWLTIPIFQAIDAVRVAILVATGWIR